VTKWLSRKDRLTPKGRNRVVTSAFLHPVYTFRHILSNARPCLVIYHRGRIVGLYQGGHSIGDIAKRETRSHQTISSIIHCDIAPDGSVNPPIHAKGRPNRQIPSPSKRAVLADIDQNRHTPTKTLANDYHISRQSIYKIKIASSAGLRSDKEELVPEIKSADDVHVCEEWAVKPMEVS